MTGSPAANQGDAAMHIGIFCGSRDKVPSLFRAVAREVGTLMANRGHGLVYGGGGTGLMGEVARGALAAGGSVIGVIPSFMVGREIMLKSVQDMRVVRDMAERKGLMISLSDAFLVLPGGVGTLEELFEVWSGGSLSQHDKPVALLNASGFYDHLLRFLDRAEEESFVRPAQRKALRVATSPAAALDDLEQARGHA